MACPGEGPCEVWDLDLECCLPSGRTPDPCLDDGTPVPQAVVDQMKLVASQFLWRKTGMQFGLCTATIRPLCWNNCPSPCEEIGNGTGSPWIPGSYFGSPWIPVHLSNGDWTNVKCSGEGSCTCVNLCEIDLPYPVCSIDEVKVDGLVLDPDEYVVRDFRKLIRTKSPQPIARQTELRTIQFGLDAPGDQFCFEPNADSATDASPAGADCWTFDDSNPTWTWNSVEKFTATYDDPTGPEENGSFRIRNNLHGDWDFPVNSTPMEVGETRWSNPDLLTGDRISITWNGPGIGPHVDGVGDPFTREGGGSFTVVNLALQAGGCWPDCNNLTLDDTEIGTWSVTVTYGRPVPELVRLAAQEFACELIKGCVGQPCKLPQRMQSITRQGVSVSFLDPMDFLEKGMTGIFMVDLAIKTYNPHGLYKKPSVSSPDSLGQRSVITWPPT